MEQKRHSKYYRQFSRELSTGHLGLVSMTSWTLLLFVSLFVLSCSSGSGSQPFLTMVSLGLLTCPLSLVFWRLVGLVNRREQQRVRGEVRAFVSGTLLTAISQCLPTCGSGSSSSPQLSLTPQCASALTVVGRRILHSYMLVTPCLWPPFQKHSFLLFSSITKSEEATLGKCLSYP